MWLVENSTDDYVRCPYENCPFSNIAYTEETLFRHLHCHTATPYSVKICHYCGICVKRRNELLDHYKTHGLGDLLAQQEEEINFIESNLQESYYVEGQVSRKESRKPLPKKTTTCKHKACKFFDQRLSVEDYLSHKKSHDEPESYREMCHLCGRAYHKFSDLFAHALGAHEYDVKFLAEILLQHQKNLHMRWSKVRDLEVELRNGAVKKVEMKDKLNVTMDGIPQKNNPHVNSM